MPLGSRYVGIDPGPVVEVESGKVQLADIARVIHVAQEDVHVLSGTETWKVWELLLTEVENLRHCQSLLKFTHGMSAVESNCSYLAPYCRKCEVRK